MTIYTRVISASVSIVACLVSTIWFKPSVFQTDKEIQRCAGGAQLRKGSFNCLC